MVWGPGGYLWTKALDFAGGTVVHINSGVGVGSGVRSRKRIGYGKEPMPLIHYR